MNEQPTQSNSRLASFARASWSIARAILHGPCGAFVVMAWVCGEMAKVFRRQTACLWRFFWQTTRISFLVLKPIVVLAIVLLVVADFHFETTGLPPRAREFVIRKLAERGICAEVERIHAGVIHGIVLDNLVIFDEGDVKRPMFRAQTVAVTPHLWKLVAGRLEPRTIVPSDLEIYPPLFPTANGMPRPIARLGGSLRFHRDVIEVHGVTGEVAGIRFQLDGRISQLPPFDEKSQPPSLKFGWQRILEKIDPELREQIRRYAEVAGKNSIPPGDGRISMQFDLPLLRPKSGTVSGDVYLADAAVRGVDIRSLRLQFSMRKNVLQIHGARMHIIGDQTVTLDGEVNFAEKTITAEMAGSLNPEVAVRLAGYSMPAFLADARFGAPLKFKFTGKGADNYVQTVAGTLECSLTAFRSQLLAIGEMKAVLAWETGKRSDLSVQAADLSWHGVPIASVRAATAQFNLKTPKIDQLEIVVNPTTGEQIRGTASVLDSPAGQRLFADLDGNLLPATIFRLLPEMPPAVSRLTEKRTFFTQSPAFTCHLEAPAANLREGQAHLELQTGTGMLDEIPMTAGRFKADFSAKSIVVEQHMEFGRDKNESLTTAFTCDLETQRMQGTATGKAYLDRIMTGLHLPYNYILNRISQPGGPAEFAVTLADSPLNPAGWSGSGTIRATDACYEDLRLATATGLVVFSPGLLSFQKIQARTQEGDDLVVDVIDIGLPQGNVRLSGTVTGDPRLARVFVPQTTPRAIYDGIFKDFVWDPQKRPQILIRNLEFTSAFNEWRFVLDASIGADSAVWRGVKTDRVEAEVGLDLPGTVTVKNAKVVVKGKPTTGDVTLSWNGTPSCRFRVDSSGCQRELISAISPAWKQYFEKLTLSDEMQISCKDGSLLLGADPRPRLRGTITIPACQYGAGPVKFTNLSANWLLDGGQIHCTPVTATYFGGTVSGAGYYDCYSSTGQITLSGFGIRMSELMDAARQNKIKSPPLGELSGSCRLELANRDGENPLQLNGTGNIRLTQADLQAVPIVSRLGDLVGFGGLGRMDRLDASLAFAGDSVFVPEFHTNGTVFALKGDGNYNRRNQQLDFRVKGEMFKSTFLKNVFRPLTWFFEAELSGTAEKPRWRMLRSFGDSKPEDSAPAVP